MASKSPTIDRTVSSSPSESVILAKIIARSFLSLPYIARDLNVARQNLQKMVKMRGGEASKGADTHFLKAGEAEKKLAVEQERGTAKKVTPVKKEEEGTGLFGKTGKKVFDKFKSTKAGGKAVSIGEKLLNGFKAIFNPKNFMKILGRLALPLMIFSALFEGFTSAFDTWKETGSIWEAFKAGIGGIVEFFTFGLIDKKMVSDFYDWGLGAIEKIMKSVADFFGFGDVFTEQFAKVKKFLGVSIQPKNQPQTPSIDKPKEGEGQAKKDKELSKQEVERLEKEKQYTGKDEIVRKRMGLPPKPASEMEPTPTAPAAAETQPSKAPSAAPVSPSDTKPVKVGESAGKSAMIKAMDDNKITDPTARASIMAQVGHESGNFTTLSENLNYKPATLLKIFPKYFRSPEEAQETASQGPQAIANRVYGGRMGNTDAGDGFKYRGRGFIQLTGKANYKRFGVDSDPDSVSQMGKAAETAIQYMKGYKGDWGDIKAVTKFVNGGYIGLEDRAKHFQAYLTDPTITKVDGAQTAISGGGVATASNDVASSQRQQAKPSAPVVVNNTTVNNNNSSKTQLAGAPKDNTSTNGALLARAT
jgi:putative chitinase